LRLNFIPPPEILPETDAKLPTPTSKLQRNSKSQAAIEGRGRFTWNLELGASQNVGALNLELLNAVSLPPV
jgi:hypothetical protein